MVRLEILSCFLGLCLLAQPSLANHNPPNHNSPNYNSPGHNPIETLQKLQAVQDALVGGDAKALDAQARILSELGAQLENMDIDFFREPKNFYVVLLYLVHGGNPEHVSHILEATPPEGVDNRLIEAVVAYAQGREGDFHAALEGGSAELDNANWPRTLRASLYLALTPYIARKDLELADTRLDYVRLVAPGSLYEEAALRRQIKITAKLGKEEKLGLLVRHYATRFPNSPYMRDFWAEVAESLAIVKDSLSANLTETILAEMPEKLRYPTYLRFARHALIEAKLDEASRYAHIAQDLAQIQGLNDDVAQFYQLAALAATPQASTVKDALQSLKIETLPPRDRALAVAARNVAEAIAAQSAPSPAIEVDGKLEATLSAESKPDESPDERIESFLQPIQKRLDEIDTLLENEK